MMISKLYKITVFFKKHTKYIWKFIYKLNKIIINIFYPLFKGTFGKSGVDEKSDIIISLTSYPARINTVWMTIETLLRQKKVKPKKVILWLASNQFPNKKIPKKLQNQTKRGLEIKYCDDLKPHKKYYYTFKSYPKNLVVTVDDDVFYNEDFLEQLYKGHIKYPNAVVCNWAHKMTFNKNKLEKYNNWDMYTNELSLLTVPIGCCGVLYNPKFFDEELYDIEKIKKLCFYTDDLWLKFMELKNSVPAVNVNESNIIYFCNIRSSFSGLYKKNTAIGNRNDQNLIKLLEEYPNIFKNVKE